MGLVTAMQVPRRPVSLLEPIIGGPRYAASRAADQTQQLLAGRTIWNVNSTATGGGVAEMLQVLVGYITDLGIPVGWLVITGDAEFFTVTKRLHNQIHGDPRGGPLGAAERITTPRVAPAGISAAASSADVTLLAIVLDPDRSATPQTRPEIC